MLKKKELAILVIVSCLVLLGIGYKLAQLQHNRVAEEKTAAEQLTAEQNTFADQSQAAAEDAAEPAAGTRKAQAELIKVHVAGAVSKPGLYELPVESRIYDAVMLAGTTADSDLDALNLAQPVSDGAKIVVGSLAAQAAAAREEASESSAAAADSGSQPVSGYYEAGTEAADSLAAPGAGGDGQAASGSLVNINTAGLSELQTLPGIGEVLGQRIIDYRTANGSFGSKEEIKNVSGIGSKRYEALAEYITV